MNPDTSHRSVNFWEITHKNTPLGGPAKEARSKGKEKCGNAVKFNKNTKYMNSMDTSAVPKKRMGGGGGVG